MECLCGYRALAGRAASLILVAGTVHVQAPFLLVMSVLFSEIACGTAALTAEPGAVSGKTPSVDAHPSYARKCRSNPPLLVMSSPF